MNTEKFDATEMLNELDAGVFTQKLSRALADAAVATCEHNRKSEITLKFSMKRIGESSQVTMTHSLVSSRPTRRGTAKEDDTTATPMYVGTNGRLSIVPFSQRDLFARGDDGNQKENHRNVQS